MSGTTKLVSLFSEVLLDNLTERGHQILADYRKEQEQTIIKLVGGNISLNHLKAPESYCMPLWEFMKVFGPYISDISLPVTHNNKITMLTKECP